MQAGKLRHRLNIQQATETQSVSGAKTKTWSTCRTVWGSVDPLKGQELFYAQQTVPLVTHKITIRGEPVKPSYRIEYKSRIFAFSEMTNWQERGIYSVAVCQEVPA